MRHALVALLAVSAALSAVAGALAGAHERSAEKPKVFVATGGSDDASCRARKTPCATLDRAYRAARPGELVEVAGGSYPEQVIVADPRKRSSKHVVIAAARGAKVTLAGLTLGSGERGDGPRHLTLRGLHTAYVSPREQSGIAALPGTRDVVWDRMDAGSFTLWGVQDMKIRGGDWGPCEIGPGANCSNAKIDAGPEGYPTRRVTVDGARVHDFRFGPDCWSSDDCHFECMYVNASENVTIRRSTFRDCALYDIFVTISGPDAAQIGHRNLTIENNWFDTPWDEAGPGTSRRARMSALALNWCQNSPLGYRGVRIRHNSFQSNTGMLLDPNPECRFENVRVVGNLMAFDGCDGRWNYSSNVFSTALRRGRCAPSDRIAGAAFPYRDGRSGAGMDFHLRRQWRLTKDRVTDGCAPRDIDGQRRPRRSCDAGADRELR